MRLLLLFLVIGNAQLSHAQSFFWQGSGVLSKNKTALGVFGVLPTNFSNIGFTGNFSTALTEFYQLEARLGVNTAPSQSAYFGLLGKAALLVNRNFLNVSTLFGFEHQSILSFVIAPVASHYFDFGEFYMGIYSKLIFDQGAVGLSFNPGLNFEMGRNWMRLYIELQLGLANSPSSIGSGVRWFF